MLVCVFSLFFLFFLMPGCDGDGPAQEAGKKMDATVQKQQGQFDEAEKEIAEAKAEIENLRNDLTQARLERDEAQARLEKAEQERRQILKEMEQLNTNGQQPVQDKTSPAE
jgi:chromosome segregation ATPase